MMRWNGAAALAAAALSVLLGGRACKAQAPRGTIAYIQAGKLPGEEIRLIEADGSGDRLLWKVPVAIHTGVTGLSWSPDGKELAFASDHDAAQSVYESNIYAVHADGTGLRQLTDPPGASRLAGFARGKVKVTLRNHVTDVGLFLVYVSGAPAPQKAVVAAGHTVSLTFDDVAAFDGREHAVAAINGFSRWILPMPAVRAGQTVDAGVLDITPHPHSHFGFEGPTWSSDGKKVACILGMGAGLFWTPPHPQPGSIAPASLVGGQSFGVNCYDLGPTPATADEVLYGGGLGNQAIRRTTMGSGERGEPLVEYGVGEMPAGLQWLPDASGFLFAKTDFVHTNLYRYDFATKQVKQLTHLEPDVLGGFAISPDGRWVAFDRRAPAASTAPRDLWLMRIDGSDMKLLAKNGASPAWSRTRMP